MTLNKITINDNTTVGTGIVYDISKATNRTYANLAEALGNNGDNIPEEFREGGMAIKFIQYSTNKYLQYHLKIGTFSYKEVDWLNSNPLQQSRFVNVNNSKFKSEYANFVVKARIKNAESGYRYAISAIIDSHSEKDVYLDKFPEGDPSSSTHITGYPTFHNIFSGKLQTFTKSGVTFELIVDWSGVEGKSLSWGTVWIEFSDYTYEDTEEIPDTILTANSNSPITSGAVANKINEIENIKADVDYPIQLFNKDSAENRRGYYTDSTYTPDSSYYVSHRIFVRKNRTYCGTIYPIGMGGGSSFLVVEIDENYNILSAFNASKVDDYYTVLFDHDCYISLNLGAGDYSQLVFCELIFKPSEYVEYVGTNPLLSNSVNLNTTHKQTIQECVQNKADLIYYKSKNLYNKADIEIGWCFDYGGTPYEKTGACMSGLIPVKPNTMYHLYRPLWGEERTIHAYKADGSVAGKLRDEEGNAIDDGLTQRGKEITFITPAVVSFIRFNIDWYPTYVSGHEDGFQLEEGNEYTGYEDYFEPYCSIPYNELPKDLNGLSDRVSYLESLDITPLRIDIKSSDKVGFFSNSFLNGYTMLGKHAIEKLMMFSDYLPYNYSKSGDDMIEVAERLDRDTTWLGVCKPSEIGVLKYGFIMHQDNDGIVFSADHRTYYENAKKLGYEIMALGAQPILSTEHDWANNYLIFLRLCQDEGWQFTNWGKVYSDISVGVYKPMWHSDHPATRSNWCQVHGFLPIIQSLPRPTQSIKLFRLRSTIDSSDLKNALYNTLQERAERWIELHNGLSGIKAGLEARFDRWGVGGYSSGHYDLQDYNCEYQNLIKHISTSFGSHLLADITTPYNVRSITKFILYIVGTGITKLYARQIRYMDNSWLPRSSAQYVAFGITNGEDLLHIGDTITISGISRSDGANLNKSYTIGGISNGYVITTDIGTNYTTSGTDEPVCNISGVTLSGSYKYPSGNYMNNYNKPIGQWTEVSFTTIDNNISVVLTKDLIEKFGVADKFVFMAVGIDISITDIYADVVGSNLKERNEKSIIIPEPKIGQSALSTTTFTASDIAWENLSNNPIVAPVTDGTYTERLPGTVREIPTNGWLALQLDTSKFVTSQYKKPLRIQFQILARWFPKYILTDADYETSELIPDSFDMAKLEVQLNTSANPSDNLQFPVTTMYIGAWWNVYVFEMDLVGAPTWLTLKCVDKRVQIAKCDLIVLND